MQEEVENDVVDDGHGGEQDQTNQGDHFLLVVVVFVSVDN